MRTWLATAAFQGSRVVSGFLKRTFAVATLLTVRAAAALAQPAPEPPGREAALNLPDLSQVTFLNGSIAAHRLLLLGILFCIFWLAFRMVIFTRLKNQPV